MTLYEFGMRFAAPVFRFILRARAVNAQDVPTGPLVLCANHRSNFDPVILASCSPRQLHYMAKAELFRVPILAPLITELGAFPVRRGEGDTEALKAGFQVLEQNNVLGMFPEMHRNRNKTGLMRFHSGALRLASQAGAPILPVAIVREKGVWPFRRVRVVFGHPVKAEKLGFEEGNKRSLHNACENLRREVLRMLEDKRS